MKRFAAVWVRLGFLLALLAAPAMANPKADAAECFKRAMALVHGGRIREGLDEFLRAYELSPNYVVLYNIGQAYADLGRPTEAIDTLKRYLSEGGDRVTPARRTSVEATLRDLESKTGLIDFVVDVPGAELWIDGHSAGRAPLTEPLRVDAGAHVVSASGEGFTALNQDVNVVGGGRIEVKLKLRPPILLPMVAATSKESSPPGSVVKPEQPSVAPVVAPAPASRSGSNWQRGLGIVVGLVGLVSTGVGTYFALRSQSKGHQSDQHCGASIGQPPNICDDVGLTSNQQAIDASTASIISFSVGGAALISGTVLLVTAPSASAPRSSAAGFVFPSRDGARVMLSGTF